MTAGAPSTDLFGEPVRLAEESQWFTPRWLARRAAQWLPWDATVLEPSAGSGNLVAAALSTRAPRLVVAVEHDSRFAVRLLARFDGDPVEVCEADFLAWEPTSSFDCALTNPPYEDGQDAQHLARALELCGRAVAIVKSDFEFGAERDRTFWRLYRPVRRGICVDRPAFGSTDGGGGGAARNYVALAIVPRDDVGPAYTVLEERWRRR